MEQGNEQPKIKRINGYLHRVVPIADSAGKVLNYALSPVMVEFKPRDLMQVIVGASILATSCFHGRDMEARRTAPIIKRNNPQRAIPAFHRAICLLQLLSLYIQGTSLGILQTHAFNIPLFTAHRRNTFKHHTKMPLDNRPATGHQTHSHRRISCVHERRSK
ncbi:hypothetical protein ACFLQY_02065 [Verrucomicrobiota bacterium]